MSFVSSGDEMLDNNIFEQSPSIRSPKKIFNIGDNTQVEIRFFKYETPPSMQFTVFKSGIYVYDLEFDSTGNVSVNGFSINDICLLENNLFLNFPDQIIRENFINLIIRGLEDLNRNIIPRLSKCSERKNKTTRRQYNIDEIKEKYKDDEKISDFINDITKIMNEEDPWKILQIDPRQLSPEERKKKISRTFFELIRKYHPDKCKYPKDVCMESEKAFIRIEEAKGQLLENNFGIRKSKRKSRKSKKKRKSRKTKRKSKKTRKTKRKSKKVRKNRKSKRKSKKVRKNRK